MKLYQIDTEKQSEEVLIAIKEKIPFAVEVVNLSITNTIDLLKKDDKVWIDDIYNDRVISVNFNNEINLQRVILDCEKSVIHIESKISEINTIEYLLQHRNNPLLYFYPKQ